MAHPFDPYITEIAPGEYEVKLPPGTEYICDFCSGQPVVMEFAVVQEAVKLQPTNTLPGFNDRGNWAACADCAKLIQAEDQPALTRRSAELYLTRIVGTSQATEPIIKKVERELEPLHTQFFHARQRAKDDAIGTTERTSPT